MFAWTRPSVGMVLKIAVPLAVVVGLSISYANRDGDFSSYVKVGELQISGHDAYREASDICSWPPLFCLGCIPLAAASHVSFFGARLLWLLFNWAALAWALALVVRFVYDRRLVIARSPTSPADTIDIAHSAVLLPLLFCSCWIVSNFEYLQVNILIFALALTGLMFHRRGCDARAGLLIGAAAALKVFPILFAPYFLWRRQWRAALYTAVFAIGWSLLPAAVYGWGGCMERLATWRDTVGKGLSVGLANMSVYAMFDRWIGHGMTPLASPGVFALSPSHDFRVFWFAGALVLLTASLGVWLFRGPYDRKSRATVAEWSVVFLVAAIFGALTWKHYLVVLLLPMTLFVAVWRDETMPPAFRRRLRLLTWLVYLPSLSGASDIVGGYWYARLQTGSILTMMSLLILGMLFWCKYKLR